MVFELAHNAEYHWHGTDQDADQENQVSDAMAHCRRLHQEERESFNADLPVRLGEAFEGLSPEMLEKARAVPVETLEFETGVITDSERRTVPGHPHPIDLHCSHVAFFHQGNKHVKGVGDPYPKDYPAELAHRHATEVLTSLDHPDPALLQGVQNTARHLQTLAENSLHCLTQTGLREFMEAARSAGLPNGGIQAMLNVATTYDRSLTNQLMLTGGIAKPTASTQQVKQVLQAARRAGLDDYKLREIAEALDHDDTAALNIPTRTVSPKKVRSIANAARRAGFSQEAIKSIENFLDGEDE